MTDESQIEGGNPRLAPPSEVEIRREFEELVLKDLLGPHGGPEEELPDVRGRQTRPSERYLVGMLAPKHAVVGPELQDDLPAGGASSPEESTEDDKPSASDWLFPSSFGLTFCVDGGAKEIQIDVGWGRYERGESAELTDEKGGPLLVWRRLHVAETLRAEVREGAIDRMVVTQEQPDVYVTGRVHPGPGGDWLVTLFLVNEQDEPDQLKDRAWLFQPEIRVSSPEGTAVFVRRRQLPAFDKLEDGRELEELEMAYREHVEFAVGHGVSVAWETEADSPDRALWVATASVPIAEVPKTLAPTAREVPALQDLVLDMKDLADATPANLAEMIRPLANAYEAWIGDQRTAAGDPASDLGGFRGAPDRLLGRAETALHRIREGIELLETDEIAAEAFEFMNRAMWLQRVRTMLSEQTRRGGKPTFEDLDQQRNRSWRPFQLAFILLSLPSLTRLDHPERRDATDGETDAEPTAELLWFPTGGGKTEAYLGLTSYTLALRRLQGQVGGREGEPGVAVLMRYTLRLLTLQQFQRASTLICACEAIRRQDESTWGRTPFRIGLWVGQRSTPNSTDEARKALDYERTGGYRGGIGGSGTPRQLTHCPWCGCEIHRGTSDICVDGMRGRTLIYCGDSLGACEFGHAKSPNEGLPVVVVDEEIYRLLPSLVIATVDKFAQMPWKGEVQMLFGQVQRYCPRHGFLSADLDHPEQSHRAFRGLPGVTVQKHAPLRPPDLIIQDELHLITGPLGSLVGIYETAVDGLCCWFVDGNTVRPKIIASTATIRRASDQVNRLFMRRLMVFPPPGVSHRNSFFAQQVEPSEEVPGARYIGICAPGRRLKAALIRVYVACLCAGQLLYDKYGIAADPWMTLVGYFGSIRELGGMRRLYEDDIRTRARRMKQRGLGDRLLWNPDELTSRKTAADIPDILDHLEVKFDPEAEPCVWCNARGARGSANSPLTSCSPQT